jgi:CBS domain containing-hemolysin-like protein
MESQAFYIHEDEKLVSSLASFLRTGRTTLIVVDITGDTVGMVSLADVIETLFGHKIVDDFDSDDDLQAVASRRA